MVKIIHSPLTTIFAMPPSEKAVWEKKGDDLNIAMLLAMNSKNETMKREL